MSLLRLFRRTEAAPARRAPSATDDAPARRPARALAACPGVHEYLAAALDAGTERGAAPVLGPRAAFDGLGCEVREYVETPSLARLRAFDERALLARFLEGAEAWEADGSVLCLVDPRDGGAAAGVAHALLGGKRLVAWEGERDPAPPESARSLVLVATSARVASLGLDRLAEAFRGRRWGLLVAPDAASLSHVVAKAATWRPHAEPRGRVYWCLEEPPTFSAAAEELEVVARGDLTVESAAAFEEESVPLSVFIGHGRAHCFASGVLCSGDPRDAARPLRCCGSFACLKLYGKPDLPVIRARRLCSDVVLLDSCLSMGFPRYAPEADANLGVELLRGRATAAVGAHRLSAVSPMTPFLFWSLARAGDGLGEIVRATNDVLCRELNVMEQLVLYGDPEAAVFAPDADAVRDLRGARASATCYEAEARGEGRHVTRYRCADPALLELPEARLRCDVGAGAAPDVCAWILGKRGGALELLVVDANPGARRAVPLVLTTAPAFDPQVLRAADALCEEYRFASRGEPARELRDGELAEDAAEPDEAPELGGALAEMLLFVDETIAGFEGLHRAGRLGVEALRIQEQQVLALMSECNRELAERVAAALQEQALPRAYFERAWRTGLEWTRPREQPCPTCGGRVRDVAYRVGYLRAHERVMVECERCEILCDVERGRPLLFLAGPDDVHRGGCATYELVVENPGERPVFADVVCDVFTGKIHHPFFRVSPRPRSERIAPGGRARFEIEVEAEPEAVPHEYRLKANVALDCRLSFANRMFRVTL